MKLRHRSLRKFLLFFLVGMVLLPPATVFADPYGLNSTAASAGLKNVGGTNKDSDVTELAGRVIGAALSMIGIVFFILMIYAGLRWMTARGNSELTQKALDTMVAAVIGMVVVLASYALTQFVFQAVPSDNTQPPPDIPGDGG